MKNITLTLTLTLTLLSLWSLAQTISSLPAATTLGGTEVAAGVQGGVTKKISMNQIKTFNWDLSPTIDVGDTITYVLVRRTSDGKIYRRSVASIGSGFWPLTGTGTATGSIIIEGGGTPNELTIQNFDQIDLASNGGFGLTAQDLTVGVVDGMVFNASNGDMHFQTVNNKLTLEGDTLELENFVAGIRIDGNFGTAGQALTSNGPGAAPTWETPAGGAGGHTIEDEGTPLTARSKLNFVGAGVTATDDSGDDASVITIPNPTINTSTSLTDGAAITITGTKHTLTSTQATVTWTLSQTSDFQTTDIILNATTTTWTFPANTLCVYEGVASGDNTAVLSGTSGDHYIMSTYKDGTNYRTVIKNFGQ